jgi:two-component system response regulator AtoC
MATILVIDDDRGVVESFRELFRGEHRLLGAYNGSEALSVLRKNEVDLVFLDYRLPGDDGLAVLKSIRELAPELDVVLITAHGSFETIVQSIALGACDYLEKPLDIERIGIITRRVLESRKMRRYVRVLRDEQSRAYDLARIVGRSQPMLDVFKAVGRLVNNDVPVLISGESGTGKELIARALHFNGPRRDEPFVAVNCSGLPEGLLENELFGHEAQAYTGATSQRAGRFEVAGEGTVFLDEIGDMSASLQAKLLRVLQEREFQRLGGTRSLRLKARLIAATNKNLNEEMRRGRFREDLYYRINVATLAVPPLRERREDIPALVNHFLSVAAHKLNKQLRGITDEALEVLLRYPWPGNVRELENVILSLGINNQSGVIEAAEIPRYLTGSTGAGDLYSDFLDAFLERNADRQQLLHLLREELEPLLLRRLLERLGGNRTAAAARLGISRVTLQHRLQRLQQG